MFGKFSKSSKGIPKNLESDSSSRFSLASSSNESENVPKHELIHRRVCWSKEPLEDPYHLELSMDIEESNTKGEIEVETQVETKNNLKSKKNMLIQRLSLS